MLRHFALQNSFHLSPLQARFACLRKPNEKEGQFQVFRWPLEPLLCSSSSRRNKWNLVGKKRKQFLNILHPVDEQWRDALELILFLVFERNAKLFVFEKNGVTSGDWFHSGQMRLWLANRADNFQFSNKLTVFSLFKSNVMMTQIFWCKYKPIVNTSKIPKREIAITYNIVAKF